MNPGALILIAVFAIGGAAAIIALYFDLRFRLFKFRTDRDRKALERTMEQAAAEKWKALAELDKERRMFDEQRKNLDEEIASNRRRMHIEREAHLRELEADREKAQRDLQQEIQTQRNALANEKAQQHRELQEEKSRHLQEIEFQTHTFAYEKALFKRERKASLEEIELLGADVERSREDVLRLETEKSRGFPWLAEAYSEYNYLEELKAAELLETKKHPALKAAGIVRGAAERRRHVEQRLRVALWTIKYWTNMLPFLEDLLNDADDELLQRILKENVEEPIRDVSELPVDPSRVWLSKEEWESLPPGERNQLALDRYWTGRKANWQVGRDYERYIGYLHERDGWSVYYQGILEGYEDLGRDLIVKKSGVTKVIQCKYWAAFRTIHEAHVNQLFGTVTKYRIENPSDDVGGVLCTTTTLSPLARSFAQALGIEAREELPFQPYPCIKCNVSRQTGELIYHLPFDQLYDRTIIEPSRGEFYARTVAEAETAGFRRAWRWLGDKSQT